MATPLVTAPTPLSILPVPLVNTGVKVVEPPTVSDPPAVRDVATGAATTVIVAVVVAVVPAAFVTVKV